MSRWIAGLSSINKTRRLAESVDDSGCMGEWEIGWCVGTCGPASVKSARFTSVVLIGRSEPCLRTGRKKQEIAACSLSDLGCVW
jgi:hypothetical protein